MNVMLWVVAPLSVATVLYALLSVGYFWVQGRPGMAMAFFGYALANIGFIWDALTVK